MTLGALREFLGAASALEQTVDTGEEAESILGKSRKFWTQASGLFGLVCKAYPTGKFFVTAWQEMGAVVRSDTAQQPLLSVGNEAQKLLPPPN